MRIQVGASARCKTDKNVVKAIERYADKEHNADKGSSGKAQADDQGKEIHSSWQGRLLVAYNGE